MAGKIRWLGHAFVEFTTSDGKVILIDPWTKDDGNPACPIGLDGIENADLVLFSHDHADHVASAVAICNKTGALLGGPVQSVRRLVEEGFNNDQVLVSLERRMKCGIGKCGHCNLGEKFVCTDGPVFSLADLEEIKTD